MKVCGKFFCGVACVILLALNGQAAKVTTSPEQYLFGQATFPGPASPSYVASGDFNGDGKLDFVLADPQHAVVSVLIGRPDGTFAPPVNFSTGKTPRFVAVADFNRDGKPDLAVAFGTFTSCCSGVSILLGNGNGSFASSVDYPLNGVPFGITAGDFRGDGRLSVAIVTQDSGGSGASEVSIFPGNGDGTFASAIVSPTGPLASTVVAADFNGDGKLDLVTMEFRIADRLGNTANLAILLGNGDGSFKAPNEIIFSGETFPFALAAGDFNGDHQIDLAFVAAYFGGINAVGILAGKGDGTFVLSDPFFFTPGAEAAGATIADLNGDGNLDVAVFGASTIDVLLGQGDGTLGASTQFGIGPGAVSSLATDVNGDYEADLVFASAGGLNVVLGNGNGTFGSKKTYPASNSPLGLVAGDFKEDGHLDLAFNNADAHTVSILPGTGNGSFPTSQSFATGGRGVSIVASDFNGDAHLDVAVANSDVNSVSVLLGNGDGTLRGAIDYPVGVQPRQIIASDFNGDGQMDLAVMNAGLAVQNQSISILFGNGDGSFQTQKIISFEEKGPLSLAAGDFNLDGRADLAVGFDGSSSLSILLGNADATFSTLTHYAFGGPPQSILSADVNGDGELDLLLGIGSAVTVLVGQGDGTFVTGETYAGAGSAVAAADFTRDGNLDLVATTGSSVDSILLGNGDRTFRPSSAFRTGAFSIGLAVGDFNSDGAPDVAAVNFAAFGEPGNLAVFLSTPVAAIFPATHHAAGPGSEIPARRSHAYFTLSNPSPAPLENIQVSVSGSASVHHACPETLPPGESCAIRVGFTPGSLANLVIADNAPGSPQIIPIKASAP